MANIVGVFQGAYNPIVKLSDGTLKTLADFLRAPGQTTITGIIGGAYNSVVKLSDQTAKLLAAHVRSPGQSTIIGEFSNGYGGQIKDATGAIVSLGDQARIMAAEE